MVSELIAGVFYTPSHQYTALGHGTNCDVSWLIYKSTPHHPRRPSPKVCLMNTQDCKGPQWTISDIPYQMYHIKTHWT